MMKRCRPRVRVHMIGERHRGGETAVHRLRNGLGCTNLLPAPVAAVCSL